MKKFHYFGARMTEMVAGATGAPRKREKVVWFNKAYDTATEAAAAAASAMVKHPGVSYFVQSFDKQLEIDGFGQSKGFKAQ